MNNNKLNEGIQDILGNIGNNTGNIDIIRLPKKVKKTSVLEQLQKPINIPKSLADFEVQFAIQQSNTKHQSEEKQSIAFQRQAQRIGQSVKSQTPQVIQQQQAREDIETITGVVLPEEIDAVVLESEIVEAISNVPENLSISDIEINISKVETTTSKAGYYKTKTNIKKESIPQIINDIATYVKQHSKGIIIPRVVDLRVIGNTNKTQLKGNRYKLSANTVLFKTDPKKLQAKKYQRIMISIPENYNSTKNLLVYLQESRSKNVIEVVASEFLNDQAIIEFLGDRIAEFYYHGYEVVEKKITFRGVNNPLFETISAVLKTTNYIAKPYNDEENRIYAVDFRSKTDLNQWLTVQLIETEIQNIYDVIARNVVDSGWEFKIIAKPTTLNVLNKNIVTILDELFARDWTNELKIEDSYDKFIYEYSKLTHSKLKKAAIEINELGEGDNIEKVEIAKCLSKTDVKKLQTNDYDGEAIIGKTKNVDFFILTYLAYPIIGGDKRAGKDYITSQDYYQKYNVKDRREYSEREKTILKRQDAERNYNSRIYLFQLEYSVGGKKHVYRNKSFEDVMNNTGILTNKIKFPISLF